MFESLINGILLGFGVSVPFGPVNVLILIYALKSFKNALAIGFGAMSADLLYLALLTIGALAFLQGELAGKIISIFGFCFLSFLAFLMIRAQPKELEFATKNENQSALKSFLKGFLLNITNPYVIGFWLSTTALLNKNSHPILMFIGLILAILTWIFVLSFAVSKIRNLITPRVLYVINLISALIIEYFAIFLIYKTFLG